jgi:hypothetical protein
MLSDLQQTGAKNARDTKMPATQNAVYRGGIPGQSHFLVPYGMPTLTTNCSNNYGPYQFPEKLIPLVTAQAACRLRRIWWVGYGISFIAAVQ